MKKKSRAILLGTGTSTGIPMVGCVCPVCSSNNVMNKRLRTSILIETADHSIIVDTSPDLRQQLLYWNVKNIDAAIITHDHADHLHGIDDLRPYCFEHNKTIPVFTAESIAPHLKRRFDYIFDDSFFSEEKPVIGGGIPQLSLISMPLLESRLHHQVIGSENFYFFPLPHGHTTTSGFVHQCLAYIPDCQQVSEQVVDKLKGMDLKWLVIDCLQERAHDTHLNVEKAFTIAKRINAKNTRFIHMNHELSHERLQELAKQYFPDGRALPAYDNEELEY